MPARDPDKADAAKPDTTFDNGQPGDGAAAADVTTETGAPLSSSANAGPAADPQRIVIEQPAPEPAVYYGEGGQVPGAASATDPNKPHVQADYQPFSW